MTQTYFSLCFFDFDLSVQVPTGFDKGGRTNVKGVRFVSDEGIHYPGEELPEAAARSRPGQAPTENLALKLRPG